MLPSLAARVSKGAWTPALTAVSIDRAEPNSLWNGRLRHQLRNCSFRGKFARDLSGQSFGRGQSAYYARPC
jgi:hypothetical protein